MGGISLIVKKCLEDGRKYQQTVSADSISRKAAIEALNKEIIKRRLLDDVNDGMLDEFDTEDILRKLPPAEPKRKTGKWVQKRTCRSRRNWQTRFWTS